MVWCPGCGTNSPVGSQFCAICGSPLGQNPTIQPYSASNQVKWNASHAPKSTTRDIAIAIVVFAVIISLVAIAYLSFPETQSNPPGYTPPSSNPPPSQNNPPPTQDQKMSSVGVTVQNWDQSITFSFSIYVDGKYQSTSQIRPNQILFTSCDVYWTGGYFHNTTVELRCSAGSQVEYVEVAENTIGASVEFKINAPAWAESWA